MWMMSCSSSGDHNGSGEFNISGPFTARSSGAHNGSGGFNISGPFTAPRKLRPLIPKPTSTTTSTSNGNAGSTSATHPCFNLIHGTDLFLLNHHLEQSRRDFPGPSVISSRWNPTPEQLRALQELYRRGTRTPSAEQIQQITAQLRRYGKIEGKNVFYWFQNHKARERQKRRRQSEDVHHNLETKESDIEAKEETKKNNWGLSTNLTSILTHELQSSVSMQEDGNSVSMQRPATTDHHQESNRTDGWIQLEDREFQQRRKPLDPFATWQNIHHLSSNCSPPPPHVNHLPTTSTISSTTAATLELFPLRKDGNGGEKESEQGVATSASMNTNCTTYQFYKFL